MDYVTRRATAYRDMVLAGVTVKRLARSNYTHTRWFVECVREDWVERGEAKELISTYVRNEWQGYGISYSQRHGSRPSEFVCSFYSDVL